MNAWNFVCCAPALAPAAADLPSGIANFVRSVATGAPNNAVNTTWNTASNVPNLAVNALKSAGKWQLDIS